MVSNRDFNELISQVNKKFSQLDAEIAALKAQLEHIEKQKSSKKVDKSE